jgi:hypothetical protein
MRSNYISLFFIGVGLLAFCGAAFDWDWFLNARKARAFVALLGRGGARVFYGLLGATLITLGALMAMGVIAGPPGAYAR